MPISIGGGAGYRVVDPSRGDTQAQLIIQDSLERRHDLEGVSMERYYLANSLFCMGKESSEQPEETERGMSRVLMSPGFTYTYTSNVKEEDLGLFFWHLCWTELEISYCK